MVEARAVLNAVISSALRIPTGFPDVSSIVTVPLGAVLWELAIDGGGANDEPDTESAESIVDAGVRFSWPISDVIDLVDAFPEVVGLIEPFFFSVSGVSSETIFIPTDVPVLAGMNSVVMPCFLMAVRWG
jgi:hypothetical protein